MNTFRLGGIRVEKVDSCPVCDGEGVTLYSGMNDRLYKTPGYWEISQCVTSTCGSLWLNPRPVREEIWSAYVDYYTHEEPPASRHGNWERFWEIVEAEYLAQRFGYSGSAGRRSWRRILAFVMYLLPGWRADLEHKVMYLEAKEDGRLLDVGCGAGQLVGVMASLGWRAEGIDIDAQAVKSARHRGLRVQRATLSELEGSETYEAVVMSHVIEHLHDPLDALRHCHRLLVDGGVLVVSTPNVQAWGHRKYGRDWLALDPPRHLCIFTVQALSELARASGFQILRTQTTMRGANIALRASYLIRTRGRYDMENQPPDRFRWLGRLLQLMEWLLLKWRPGLGEELLMIGVKVKRQT